LDARATTLGPAGPTFAELLEFVPDAILGVADDGTIVVCNAQAAAMFGAARDGLLGRRIEELVGDGAADGHAALRAGYLAAPHARRMGDGAPLTARRLSGEEFPVEVSLSRFERLLDGAGMVLAAVRDASRRVELDAREHRLQAELARARRLESLGQLAGGIAHDFNNLLAVIMNFTDLARRQVDGESDLAHDLGEIRRAAERGRSLTRKLLIVGRRDVRRPGRLALRALLEDLRPLLLGAVGERIEVHYELGSARAVIADESEMEQVLLNLAVNARDAMPDGGVLRIETLDLPGADADDPNRRCVRLRVSDTGDGMTTDVLEAALEPFFTTKAAGEGSGLGLATVDGIVRDSGGVLRIASEPGTGTVVQIDLPAAPDDGAGSDAHAASRPGERAGAPMGEGVARGGARILVVDDEPQLRAATRRTLTSAGYDVEDADGVSAARERVDAGRFDAYVVDVVMPGASGPEFVAWLRARRPRAPVLYVSGYGHGRLDPAELADPRTALLDKPFTADDLLDGVARMLSGT
jgi:PAS domain S-box-containing protein